MTLPRNLPGAKRIGPGIYEVCDELHVDAEEMCSELGVPPTQENLDAAARGAQRACAEHGVDYAEVDS